MNGFDDPACARPWSQMARRDTYKQRAAERAVELARPKMILGLGAGTTARFALPEIAIRVADGRLRDVVCVAASRRVEEDARHLGIPMSVLEEHPVVDLTIDGADEVDPQMNLIKGGGGALLREKILAQASRREVIVVDDSKLSPRLGTRRSLPVEVVAFGVRSHKEFIESLGARVTLRRLGSGAPERTDQGNLILDCTFGPIEDLAGLARILDGRAGIVEHGLFVRMATDLIVAGEGGVRHLRGERIVA